MNTSGLSLRANWLILALLTFSAGYAHNLAAATAAACFNPRLVEQGVVLEQRYRSIEKLTGEKIITDSTQTVVGREEFNGKNALLTTTETTATALGVTTVAQTDTYILVQKAKTRVRSLGGKGTVFVDGVDEGTAELVFDPPLLFRYDLNPGQRHTQRVTVETTAEGPEGSMTNSHRERVTRIYRGRQTIKVPVGRRQTCKFRVVTTVTGLFGGDTKYVSTEWYDVKSGLLLRVVDEASKTVLVKGSIDGVKIQNL